MPLHPTDELPLVTLLRRVIARLRLSMQRAAAEPTVPEAAKAITEEGVPLVLPYDPERRLIPRLLRRLRWGRFLRRFPGSMDEYAPLAPDAAGYLLQRLRRPEIGAWKECVTAIWALGRLATDDPIRAEAGAVLTGLIRARLGLDEAGVNRFGRIVYLLLFCLLTLGGTVAFALTTHGPEQDRWWLLMNIPFIAGVTSLGLFVPVVVLVLFGHVALGRARINRMRAMALLTLGRWRDPSYLDVLLRTYVSRRGRIRRAAEVALREVLPLLKEGDAPEHAVDFVPDLCRALRRKERQVLDYTVLEEALEVLLLEALGKVGDERAVPTVVRIAGRGRTPPLRELAQNILPLLQDRCRQADDSNHLLRGAVQPDVAPNTLLRPTQNTETPSHQLLRPQAPASEQTSLPVQRNLR